MKKAISVLLIGMLSMMSFTSAFAVESGAKYDQYLSQVQESVQNMTPEKLNTLQSKILELVTENSDAELTDFLREVYKYTLSPQEEDEVIESVTVDTIVESPITEVESSLYQELSSSQQRMIEREITGMQSDFETEARSVLDQMIASWNEMSRYNESGNLVANIDASIEDFMSLKGELHISDYFAENQNTDSSISADIDGFYSATSAYGDEIDFSGKTNLEFIQKGQDSYLLMKNTEFETSDEYTEISLTPMIEKLTELAKDNTYLSFGNESGIGPYEVLSYFNSDNLEDEIDSVFSENLMEAYAVNGNTYFLRPTKHFCDTGKKLSNIFDPFNGKECSEKQYQNMLEDFTDSRVVISLQTGKETILSISNVDSPDAYETIDIHLIWKNGSFYEMTMSVMDTYSDIEYMSMQYISQKYLEIIIPEQPYDPALDLKLNMNRDGSIKDAIMSVRYEDEFALNGEYKNGNIDMNLEVDSPNMGASCNFSGNAYSQYIDIAGGCDISSIFIGSDSQNISLESSLIYNARNSENNLNWDLDVYSDENNYLEFNVESTAKRTQTGVYEIQAPENTIDYFDFLDDLYDNSSFYDYDPDYEYDYTEYDEYDEACYFYDSGDSTCYQYYDDKDITCDYIAETDTETCETYDYGYDYQSNEYDDYTEDCYIYDSGDSTCYQYYDDKDITCDYIAETDTETCETYEYEYYDSDYEYEYNEYDEYDEDCYIYDSGDSTCYQYYDDKNITCDYIAETDTETCETYEYDSDYDYGTEYYYPSAEDAKDAIEQ